MNKKFLSAMLTVAMFFAAGSAFVSCKDYDDDIKNLQSKIDGLQSTINTIQNQITQGYLLTGVTDVTGGVQITLSNGKTYTITNGAQGEKGEKGDKGDKGDTGATGATGAAGKNGTVWTIGEDGYWYKDGVKYTSTAFPEGVSAVGKDGAAGGSGTPGAGGATGAKGETGNYWMPESDGYFYEYTAAGVKTGKKSDFKWNTGSEGSGTPAVDAAWNSANQTLTLNGLVDATGQTTSVTISLTGNLRSLVFKPLYMFDGIETIIYPWLTDLYMAQPATHPEFKNRQDKTIQYHYLIPSIADDASKLVALNNNVVDWYGNYLKKPDGMDDAHRDAHDYIAPTQSFEFGPAWEVDYHMNPYNSADAFAWQQDQQGWSVLNPEVINYHTYTRAASASAFLAPKDNSFTVGSNTYAGFKKFEAKNGIMTSLLQITTPSKLNPEPTLDTFNDADATSTYANNNTVALWVESGDAGKVTSDYALVYPEKVEIEGLVWKKVQKVERVGLTNHGNTDANARWIDNTLYANVFTGANSTRAAKYTTENPRLGDLLGYYDECTSVNAKPIHVWDTPDGALKDPDGAALELPWNSNEGITLRDYLAIHYVQDQVNRATGVDAEGHLIYPKVLKSWVASDYEEENWGLYYEFKLVDYTVDNNVTRDSRFAEVADAHDGKIVAWNVDYTADATGRTIKEHSTAAIDREPLVQVLVKDTNGKVVLDGYILLHISNQIPPIQPNKDAVYPTGKFSFNLCDAGEIVRTYYDQFNKIVLTDTLAGMPKDKFDEIYNPDLIDNTTASLNSTDWRELKQWDATWAELSVGNKPHTTAAYTNASTPYKLGQIFERPNSEGNTNHVYRWILSEQELERLTHDAETLPVTVTRYIRYQVDYSDGVYAAAKAPYPYVYIKLTAEITRDDVVLKRFEKINNYWYGLNGDPTNWDAAIFDVREPIDGGNINTFNRSIRSTLKGNTENINITHKYYFVAEDVEVTDEYSGITYVITTNHPTQQPNYNKLYCKWITTPAADVHVYGSIAVPDEAAMEKLINSCAIDYGNIYNAAGIVSTVTTLPKGMFDNDKIYAKVKGSTDAPVLIATLNQTTGMITQQKNDMNKAVLNAVGYADDNANTNFQQRAWVGIIAANNCNVAQKVRDLEDQRNKGHFLVSWERPINLGISKDNVIDAITNANYKYLVDLLKLYDWRGLTYDANHNVVPEAIRLDANSTATNGHMWNNQQWFWAYYNVKSITIDVTTANVMTNMHQSDPNNFVKLSTITTDAVLAAGYNTTKTSNAKVTIDFASTVSGYPTNFNSASKNAALLVEMGLNPVSAAKKAQWGFIYYANNGDNVTNFDLKIPVTIEYEWGKFTRVVDLHVGTTQGNGI